MKDGSRYDELRGLLAAVRHRWMTIVVLRATARAAAAVAAILASVAVIERTLHVNGNALPLVVSVACLLAALAIAMVVWSMPRRPSDRQVARFVEERTAVLGDSAFDDSLISAIDAAERSPASASMFLPFVVEHALERVRRTDSRALIASAEIRRQIVSAAVSGAALAIALLVSLPPIVRGIGIARLRLFPGSVHVQVEPGDV